MAKKVYAATVLTGGGAGALDAIDGSILNDGDQAKVGNDHFDLDADSGAAESSPDIIAPDANAGLKRWIRRAVVIDCGTW